MLNTTKYVSLLFLLPFLAAAQTPTQTLRGRITDADKGRPLAGASILLSPLQMGTVTDSAGGFRFERVSAGRYSADIRYLGYETALLPELLIESGKEIYIEVALRPKLAAISEIVVTAPYSNRRNGTICGNALSGILDMQLRAGNNERREYTVQAGLIGLDVAAEGPFSKKSKASWLVNYRYSTIGLLAALGVPLGDEKINFQDLSFHFVFPGKTCRQEIDFPIGKFQIILLKTDSMITLQNQAKSQWLTANSFPENLPFQKKLPLTPCAALKKATTCALKDYQPRFQPAQ